MTISGFSLGARPGRPVAMQRGGVTDGIAAGGDFTEECGIKRIALLECYMTFACQIFRQRHYICSYYFMAVTTFLQKRAAQISCRPGHQNFHCPFLLPDSWDRFPTFHEIYDSMRWQAERQALANCKSNPHVAGRKFQVLSLPLNCYPKAGTLRQVDDALAYLRSWLFCDPVQDQLASTAPHVHCRFGPSTSRSQSAHGKARR